MKRLVIFIFLGALVSLANSSWAIAREGGRVPFKKMTIYCKFENDPTRELEAIGFAASPAAEVTSAIVVVYGKSAGDSVRKIQERYTLKRRPEPDLSLIFRFENRNDDVSLEVFGDDMGGMSSLTTKGKVSSLTCSMDAI